MVVYILCLHCPIYLSTDIFNMRSSDIYNIEAETQTEKILSRWHRCNAPVLLLQQPIHCWHFLCHVALACMMNRMAFFLAWAF